MARLLCAATIAMNEKQYGSLMSASDFPVKGTHSDKGYGIYMLIWSLSTLMVLKLAESFFSCQVVTTEGSFRPQTKTT